MAASLVYAGGKNDYIAQVTGDTSWHGPIKPAAATGASIEGMVLIVNVEATAGGDGSTALIAFNEPTTPSIGLPILPGTTLVHAATNNFWVQLGASSDVLTYDLNY